MATASLPEVSIDELFRVIFASLRVLLKRRAFIPATTFRPRERQRLRRKSFRNGLVTSCGEPAPRLVFPTLSIEVIRSESVAAREEGRGDPAGSSGN